MAGLSDKNAAPNFSGMLPTPRQMRLWSLLIILVMLAVTSLLHFTDLNEVAEGVKDRTGISEGTRPLDHTPGDDGKPFRTWLTPN